MSSLLFRHLLLKVSSSETISELESRNREQRSSLLSEIVRIRSSLAQLSDDVQEVKQVTAQRSTVSTNDTLGAVHCQMDEFTESTNSRLDSISSSTKSLQTSVLSLRDIGQQVINFLETFPKEIRELLHKILQMNFQIYSLLLHSQSNIGTSPTLLLESNIRFEDALGRVRELPYQWFRYWEASFPNTFVSNEYN